MAKPVFPVRAVSQPAAAAAAGHKDLAPKEGMDLGDGAALSDRHLGIVESPSALAGRDLYRSSSPTASYLACVEVLTKRADLVKTTSPQIVAGFRGLAPRRLLLPARADRAPSPSLGCFC